MEITREQKALATQVMLPMTPLPSTPGRCPAWIEAAGAECKLPAIEGLLCGRHHREAQKKVAALRNTTPPEYDGAVLIPADGCRAITTTAGQEFCRLTFTTKQSIWYGPNLAARPGDWVIQTTSPSRLILGTWKVDNR